MTKHGGSPSSVDRLRRLKADVLSRPVRPARVDRNLSVADLVEQMSGMSLQARNLGLCAEVLKRMMKDPDRPTVLLGLAGPLIAAGLRRVIRDLIVNNVVDVVVSTGGILYQDLYQARGFRHYQGTPEADDVALRELRVNRIYDTYVDEDKFWETDLWCGKLADRMTPGPHSSRDFLETVGGELDDEESILYQCRRLGVPVFAPALNDSSIGIGLTEHHDRAVKAGRTPLMIDSIRDNYELTQIVAKSKKTAAIYIAGGVPKNYINDSIVMAYIFERTIGHSYAIQVTTAVSHDGGLSGSTLDEARSWGKIKGDADVAMAWVEPSVSLPLLAGFVLGRSLAEGRSRLKLAWEGERLKRMHAAPRARGKR